MSYFERLSGLRQEKNKLSNLLGELSLRPGEEAESQTDLIREDLGRVNRKIILLPLQRLGEMLGVRRVAR